VFDEFSSVITRLVGGRTGVYALYRKYRLYYYGLDANLKNRNEMHLKDRHIGKWNESSLYLVIDPRRIREFASVVIRIASPRGNAEYGKLPHSDNLLHQYARMVYLAHEAQIKRIISDNIKSYKVRNEDQSIEPFTKKNKVVSSQLRSKLVLAGVFHLATI
jgi:hypothetical protein